MELLTEVEGDEEMLVEGDTDEETDELTLVEGLTELEGECETDELTDDEGDFAIYSFQG